MQRALFDIELGTPIINTASVPNRSPFRYPGGKTWLTPYIRQWLASQIKYDLPIGGRPRQLIEPFAGGGSVSLVAVAEKLVDRVMIVEIDEDVAAVWLTMLDAEDWCWLADEIMSFDVTYENVMSALERTDLTTKERALRTIIRNRVNRGGILAPGAGLLKNGENGKGLTSRWYPETLKKRMHAVAGMRERISFIFGDGMDILNTYCDQNDSVFFIDPPYTAAGKKAGQRLYTHWKLDHEKLFEIASNLRGDFLMTYDDSYEVREMAARFSFDVEAISMKNTHHAKLSELLIGPDLEWVRRMLNRS